MSKPKPKLTARNTRRRPVCPRDRTPMQPHSDGRWWCKTCDDFVQPEGWPWGN